MLDIPTVQSVEEIDWRDIDSARRNPDKEFELPTSGALLITMTDGTRLLFSTSEWGDVSIWKPKEDAV
jgi:hypothetical protein